MNVSGKVDLLRSFFAKKATLDIEGPETISTEPRDSPVPETTPVEVTEREVLQKLDNLHPHQSTGPNNIN